MPPIFGVGEMTILGWELDIRSLIAGLSLIFAFLVQVGLGIIWLTHLQDDVDELKRHVVELRLDDQVLANKIQGLDISGTRGLAIIKDRQDQVLHRLDKLETDHRRFSQPNPQ